jgi:hypothetical protein
MTNRLEGALLEAARVLDALGIHYALLGGLAANLYRHDVRATQDVDLAVELSPADMPRLLGAFEDAGWTSEVRVSKAETLRLTHKELARIDLLIAGTDFEKSAIDRAARFTLNDRELVIVRPEDLVVYKLIAGRGHDYEAVAAVILAGHDLDEPYITGWLEQFGMAERWPRAQEEAERMREE